MNKQDINKHWEKLSSQIEAMTIRERVIVLCASVIGIVFIWVQFVYTPLQERHKKASRSVSSLAQQEVDFSARQAELTQRLTEDPNRELRTQRDGLEKQLVVMKNQIERQLSGLIPPEKMADVLRSMLNQQEKLTLVNVKNLPVEPFNKPLNESDEGSGLFSHGMELVLEGEYFDVLEYIQRLESLKGFNWLMMNYEVLDYPKARVTVKINTLSLEEDWIGV